MGTLAVKMERNFYARLEKMEVTYYVTVRQNLGCTVFVSSPGVPKRMFRKIQNLISAYTKPGQGIATHLQYPVERNLSKNAKG
ncbi:hypothetical protein GDO81_003523 [Engystomops pustulosus]|uniref:Uncharacterized protein n=1 Tax=Engystomops pustulosus TaxID=76066 RepID=A0AAV7A439_ENGPU|nr:hypothetical protein GDO81_003523 [Engystomops pustulosus]